MAVRMRRNTPIQPETRPAIVALLSPSRVARQERAGAVMMQEELKIVEDGVSSKSSFTSVDVHEDGYLLLLQQNSTQPIFFVRIWNALKQKKMGKEDGDGSIGYVPVSTIVALQHLRRFIGGRVGLIGGFEFQFCHIENGDTVIGRVGRSHVIFIVPFAANHNHLVCFIGRVAGM